MTKTTYKWSIDQWHKLIETGVLDDEPVELLKGEIIKMSPEGYEHFCTNDYLDEYLRELLAGKAKISKTPPLVLSTSEPEPDIAVLKLPKETYRTRKPIATDVHWLVEVSKSTLEKDLNEKSAIYAENKIPEYWVVDLVNKKLIVHTQPIGDRYTQIVEYQTGVVYPQAFPDIAIALEQIITNN